MIKIPEAWEIDQTKKIDEAKRRKQEKGQERPMRELPEMPAGWPQEQPVRPGSGKSKRDERGVAIIDIGGNDEGEDDNFGKVITKSR